MQTIGKHHETLWAGTYSAPQSKRRKHPTQTIHGRCHNQANLKKSRRKYDRFSFFAKAQRSQVPLESLSISFATYAVATRIQAVRLKTYIVEDNPTIRENLIGTLEELANINSVGTADTENEGKEWLTENPNEWDLAIVDLFLKQGSGLGVLAACRDRPSRQKVVVLSNYATTDIRQRCAQLGVDAVFDKSNEIDDLVDYCIQQRFRSD